MSKIFIITSLFAILIFFACSSYNKAININTVRIEDIEINQLLHGNSSVKSLRAEWNDGTVDLYYEMMSTVLKVTGG